ncbi:MAG TPA: PHP domain-containing protein [Steroidobacteraceae bacterium]|nr:PHP domain-containing protein [Steroidobacteraceae bacterium]
MAEHIEEGAAGGATGAARSGRVDAAARIDLHTHSHCSDGTLAPAALAELAASRGVAVLALTDHDTLAGCEEASTACRALGIHFLAGVELSCQWREHTIHVVGLNIDTRQPDLAAHCERLAALRRGRIERIAQRLSDAGLPGGRLAAAALEAPSPTRTHLARALCAQGFAATVPQAFERFLQRGRPGHAETPWPELTEAVQRIVRAGGAAVLAHPHRYALSGGGLRELARQFRAAGGSGIEVSLAGMGPASAERAAALARRFGLAGSIGSDFHEPGLPWRPLGRFAKLADTITPITTCLGL